MKGKKDLLAYDDEELFRLVRNSDKDALAAIFDRYSQELYSVAFTEIRKHMPRAEPGDAAQKILIMVFASLWDNHKLLPTDALLLDFLFAYTSRAVALYIQERDR